MGGLAVMAAVAVLRSFSDASTSRDLDSAGHRNVNRAVGFADDYMKVTLRSTKVLSGNSDSRRNNNLRGVRLFSH
jgi:hypothetical protein